MMAEEKRKRTTNERLDPIPINGDSRKYLWKIVILCNIFFYLFLIKWNKILQIKLGY